MKRLPSLSLLGALVAAGTIACADGTSPIRPDARIGAPVDHSNTRAEPGTFTTIDVPGATATVAFGINAEGTTVGRYVSAGRTHGFVRTPDGEITTIDFPGAGFTASGAINNRGDIVGWYTLPTSAAIRHGFLLKDGEFTSFDPPGSIFTNALGIDERGDITGRYCTRSPCREPGSGDFHGFLLRDGEFTVIDVPGSIETNAWKINDRGEIVGGDGPVAGVVELFLYRDGAYTTFSLPNGKSLSEDNGGINARGDIVGKYCDVSPCRIGPSGHGFALTRDGFVTIDVPGSTGTSAYGINARRDVAGGYFDAAGTLHGFITRLGSMGNRDGSPDGG